MKNRKGFTLAELLIVVAIIGVLVAVSIPIFTAQRSKAILATNQANGRAAKAAAIAAYMDDDSIKRVTYTINDGKSQTSTDDTFYGQKVPEDISSWTIADFGKKVIDTWYIYFKDGKITSINCYYKDLS